MEERGKATNKRNFYSGAIRKLPRELTTELLYLDYWPILASRGVKRYMHYIRFLLTKNS